VLCVLGKALYLYHVIFFCLFKVGLQVLKSLISTESSGLFSDLDFSRIAAGGNLNAHQYATRKLRLIELLEKLPGIWRPPTVKV